MHQAQLAFHWQWSCVATYLFSRRTCSPWSRCYRCTRSPPHYPAELCAYNIVVLVYDAKELDTPSHRDKMIEKRHQQGGVVEDDVYCMLEQTKVPNLGIYTCCPSSLFPCLTHTIIGWADKKVTMIFSSPQVLGIHHHFRKGWCRTPLPLIFHRKFPHSPSDRCSWSSLASCGPQGGWGWCRWLHSDTVIRCMDQLEKKKENHETEGQTPLRLPPPPPPPPTLPLFVTLSLFLPPLSAPFFFFPPSLFPPLLSFSSPISSLPHAPSSPRPASPTPRPCSRDICTHASFPFSRMVDELCGYATEHAHLEQYMTRPRPQLTKCTYMHVCMHAWSHTDRTEAPTKLCHLADI